MPGTVSDVRLAHSPGRLDPAACERCRGLLANQATFSSTTLEALVVAATLPARTVGHCTSGISRPKIRELAVCVGSASGNVFGRGESALLTELPDDLHGTDLLAQEIKDEAGRLVHHPIAEVKRLEHVVEEGDSSATPLILTVAVTAGIALIVAVVLTLVFVAYYTA